MNIRPAPPTPPPPRYSYRFDRLFFALLPDAETAQRITLFARQICDEHSLGGSLMRPDRLHVTLAIVAESHGLWDVDIQRARQAAARVSRSTFDVSFDSVTSFGRACVLDGGTRLGPLFELQRALGGSMVESGLDDPRRHFRPHMTLLYGRRLTRAIPAPPITWKAREIVLVHSLVGLTEHRPLGRWPLDT